MRRRFLAPLPCSVGLSALLLATVAVLGAPGASAADDGQGRTPLAPAKSEMVDGYWRDAPHTAKQALAQPQTAFEMPFPCRQEWTGTTRSSHSPSPNAVDWNRPNDDGDPVVAAAPGVVAVADTVDNGGYGKWVMISHPNGESTIYGHLSVVSVQAGQTVDQGTQIGQVGSTGNSTGPHLHFEERVDGVVVHPYFHGVSFEFGTSLRSQNCADAPLAGNFIGDARAELVVYRRAPHSLFIVRRQSGREVAHQFGTSKDDPVIGDWDGNGRANLGIRSPLTRTFSLRTATGTTQITFGGAAAKPVGGDWDGDGTWEIGVWQPKRAQFRLRASDGSVSKVAFGTPASTPVTGDWNGDGVTDLGVYDTATATYTLRLVDEDGLVWTAQVPFGEPGDLPVVGDWDGNLKSDLGVWRLDSAVFLQRRAASATDTLRRIAQIQFGNPADPAVVRADPAELGDPAVVRADPAELPEPTLVPGPPRTAVGASADGRQSCLHGSCG
ncbi:MAG: VCBS repeat domain-containing M23 family metallopeptidase [Nocardioides sp.]